MGNHNLFKAYRNPTFVETGTYQGGGVQTAIECGFEKIISIEASIPFHTQNVERFKEYPNVSIVLGRSEIELPRVLSSVSGPATIWLDAHGEWVPPYLDGYQISPLKAELEALANVEFKGHTILIDDMKIFDAFALTVDMVTAMLLRINPGYNVHLVPPPVCERSHGVLAACLK